MRYSTKFVEIFTFFFSFEIVVGTLGNMAAIIFMCKRWSSLKSTEVFIFVLAVIDLFLSCAVPLQRLYDLGVITFPLLNDFGCQFLTWLVLTLNTNSVWVMVAIAVDRFIMIVVKPYSFRRSKKNREIAMINVAIFLLASTLGVIFFCRIRERGRRCLIAYISAEEDFIHSASIFATQLVVPAFILTTLYSCIIIKL